MKVVLGLFGLLRHTDLEKAYESLVNMKKDIGEIEVLICIPEIRNEFEIEKINVEDKFKKFLDLGVKIKLYPYSAEEFIKLSRKKKLHVRYGDIGFYTYRVLSFFYGIKQTLENIGDYDVIIISRLDHLERLKIYKDNFFKLNLDKEKKCYILRQHDFRLGFLNAEDRGFIINKYHKNIIQNIFDKLISKKILLRECPEKIIYNELIKNGIECKVGSACSDPCPFPPEVAHIHPTHPRGPGCDLESCLYRYKGVVINDIKNSQELKNKVMKIIRPKNN
jgi:hypothetical protein